MGPISHLMFVSWYCSFQKKNHRFLDNYLTVCCFACWISFAWLAFLWFWISSLKFGFSLRRSQLFFISVWFDHFFLFRLGNHDCYISFLFLFSIWLSFLCINHMNLLELGFNAWIWNHLCCPLLLDEMSIWCVPIRWCQ